MANVIEQDSKFPGMPTTPEHLRSDGWLAAVAAVTAMVALLLNLLFFNGYPLATAEVGLVLLVISGIGLIYGAAYGLGGRWLRALLEGVLVAAVLDAGGAPSPWPIAVGLGVLAFTAWRSASRLKVIAVIALAAAASSLLGVGQHHEPAVEMVARPVPVSNASRRLPTIVHIILDEHSGLEGLPSDNPRTPAVRDAIERFYLGNGFRLYSRAHSDYAYTLNSIPQILNFGQPQEPKSTKEMKQTVEKSAYFDLLARRGYRINLYQSEFLDLCDSAPIAHCLTYQSQHIGPVAAARLSTGSKAEIILRKLTSRSLRKAAAFVYKGLAKILPLPAYDMNDIRMTPLNAALAYDRFNADLAKARPGEVYFAHILLPHSPFGLTPDCRIKEGAWIRRERPGPLRPRQDAGYDQMLCALRKTEAAYRAVSASPARGNFVMIVHADHGSRTTDAKPFADRAKLMTDAEKLTNFSTLFAVRAPGLQGGKDRSSFTLSALLTSLARSNFSAGPTALRRIREAGPSQVYLDDETHIPRVKLALPQGW